MILTSKDLNLQDKGRANFKAHDETHGVTSAIQLALSDLRNPETLASPAAPNLCEEIVNEFARATASTDETAGRSLTRFAGYRYGAMRRAEEFLRAHMDMPFSSRALCQATNMIEPAIELLSNDE